MRTIAIAAPTNGCLWCGSGVAKINGRDIDLSAGTMVLIERGDTHEIRNTGRSVLNTVSVPAAGVQGRGNRTTGRQALAPASA